MSSTSGSDFSQLPHLSQEQQSLLLAALSSNSRTTRKTQQSTPNGKSQFNNGSTISPALNTPSYSSLALTSPGYTGPVTFGDTLFPDYNESNTNFDIDFPLKEDDLLSEFANFGNDDNEPGEKRKSPDDEEDEEEGENKRREGDDKIAKKPGRKLITAEPTTKRKAQNRAAQRAFRERKEKHVKDLEQKVTELEKTTDTTTQENGVLRAQIERLQTELQEYKKRLSLSGNGIGGSPSAGRGLGSSYSPISAWNGVMTDFQFNFSKFGDTSGNNLSANGRTPSLRSEQTQPSSNSNRSSQSPGVIPATSSSLSSDSLLGKASGGDMPNNNFSWLMPGNLDVDSGNFGDLTSNTDFGLTNVQSPVDLGNGVASGKSIVQNYQRQQSCSTSCTSNAQSPAASSTAAMGATSSCGTSPEPLPNYNSDQLKTNASVTLDSSGGQLTSPQNATLYDFSNIDWLSHQNGGQFDPVLFGDYRESQDAIVGDGDFSSGFFGDPYNLGEFANDTFDLAIDTTINEPTKSNISKPSTTLSSTTMKKPACASLMEKVERCRNGEDEQDLGSRPKAEMVTTHRLWTELQSCPKFLAGEFDIDTLCSELSAKATCSETGLAVPKDIVENLLWRLAGVPEGGDRAVAEQAKIEHREAMQTSNEQRKKAAH